MWCSRCQQDVPALALGDKQHLCCPRCGEEVRIEPPHEPDPSPAYDGWELDEQLRDIERVLRADKATADQAEEVYRREAARFDLPHAGPAAWHLPAVEPGTQRTARAADRGAVLGAFTWLALSLGTASFVCGGILLGWSWATGRQELWTTGLPVALAGQVALLIGLVLQLDRLWHDNRAAADKLDNVDEQLSDLKAATTLLGTSQGPAASVFYSHFAGGAGPQLLLTDLKSQIDLLAMKIAQGGR